MDQITKDTTMNEQQADQNGKTFTQEDVNRIVSERLSRDRDKRAAELEERERLSRPGNWLSLLPKNWRLLDYPRT